MGEGKAGIQGGVHPTDGWDKTLTSGKNIIRYVPKNVTVSLKQGLGPACACVVAVGDHVDQGQLIGESKHFLTACLHAPVSGKVTAVTDSAVSISVEKYVPEDVSAEYYRKLMGLSEFTREDLIDRLDKGGLVGMGGAGFPAAAKYRTKAPISHLLINASECEAFLTCDEHAMLEFGTAILNGVRALKIAAGAERAVICMEENKAHCKRRLEQLLRGHEEEVCIRLLPNKYPQGGEKQLISAVMWKEIPSGKLPADVGVIVSNVATAKAAADMIFANRPCISRIITVTGDVKKPGNYLVPLGTDIGELMKAAGDVSSEQNRVILGGPMTGRCLGENMNAAAVSAGGAAVSKVSGGLVVLAGVDWQESACIRCGSCADACPIGLTPFKIDAAIRKDKVGLCQELNAAECIACGCCSFACPSRRELTSHVVNARDRVKAKMREEAAKRG